MSPGLASRGPTARHRETRADHLPRDLRRPPEGCPCSERASVPEGTGCVTPFLLIREGWSPGFARHCSGVQQPQRQRPHGLCRSGARLRSDSLHRGPLSRVVGTGVRDHAHRTLTKLSRVRRCTGHGPIRSGNRACSRPGALHGRTPGRRRARPGTARASGTKSGSSSGGSRSSVVHSLRPVPSGRRGGQPARRARCTSGPSE